MASPHMSHRSVAPLLASLVAVCAMLASAGGCGPGQPSRFSLHADVQRPDPGAVIFLVDGFPPRLLERGCREGWLPNIRKRFIEGGARVEHANTCVPSITYAAITTLMTGAGPASHGIIGNHWFEPERTLFRDYAVIRQYDRVDEDHDVPLLYEHLQPDPSATIQTVHRRGATKIIRNWALSGAMWFFRDYTAVDKLSVTSLWRVITWANWHRRWPSVVTFYMPGVDSIGHIHGPESGAFRTALQHADHQVERACLWLEREGLLETTYLVLLSDHGMVDVDQRIDLLELVGVRWGRQATRDMRQDGSAAARARFYDRFDTVLDDQDGRRASLHFKSPAGWETRLAPPAVARILNAPPAAQRLWHQTGVALVVYRADGDQAVLRNAAGTSWIRRRRADGAAAFAYEPGAADVLGYMDDPALAAFIADGYHDAAAWSHMTATQRQPGVVSRLLPLLDLPRAGDVVLFAEPGYSFVKEAGGHGGIHRDEMGFTWCMAGPGIVAGSTIESARAIDVTPTLLDLLGKPCRDAYVQGRSLLETHRLTMECEPLNR